MNFVLWIMFSATLLFYCTPAAVAVPVSYGIYRKIERKRETVPFGWKLLCIVIAVLIFILLLPAPYLILRFIEGVLTPGGHL